VDPIGLYTPPPYHLKNGKKIELNDGTQISNPPNVAGLLNIFLEIIDDLLNRNSNKINAQLPKQRINRCSKTIFLYHLYGMHPVVYQYHILSFISIKHNNVPMNSLVYCCV
jgi:hypothetical protein